MPTLDVPFPEALPSVKGFCSAAVVNPMKCHLYTEERFKGILDSLRTFNAVALGEIGLVRIESKSSWEFQEQTMVRLLQFSMPVCPFILHMRERSDHGEVGAKCLQIRKANVRGV